MIDKSLRTINNSYVAKYLGIDKTNEAIGLRESGHSLKEISDKLNIAKSTASLWLKNVELSKSSQERITNLRILARQKASQTIRNKHLFLLEQLAIKSRKTLSGLNLKNPDICKILCSLLYWGEGSKIGSLGFVNSDPKMIFSFVSLLRKAFYLDEKKFRCLVHVHEYHNDKEIKAYWSKITNIPLIQFNRSYLKPHTGKNTKANFKGTIRVSYYDSNIAHELKAIYNTLVECIGT